MRSTHQIQASTLQRSESPIYTVKIAFHLWVKLTFNHSRQMLLFWKEKMVNEGLCRFFLVNGKRIRQLQQHFACLKKATFRLLIWDLNLREKKSLKILFLVVFFFSKRTKWESSKKHSFVLKRPQISSQSLILFLPKEEQSLIMHEQKEGKTL